MIQTLFALIFAVSTISYTVTSTRVFRALRDWIVQKTWDLELDEKGFFGEMISCSYCFSHWISYAVVLVYHIRLVISPVPLLDMLVSAWVIVAGSHLVTQVFRMCGRVANVFGVEQSEVVSK